MTLNSNSAYIFNNAPTHQVSPSYVQSFRSYRVDKQTNKKILLKTSTQLCYATPAENNVIVCGNSALFLSGFQSWVVINTVNMRRLINSTHYQRQSYTINQSIFLSPDTASLVISSIDQDVQPTNSPSLRLPPPPPSCVAGTLSPVAKLSQLRRRANPHVIIHTDEGRRGLKTLLVQSDVMCNIFVHTRHTERERYSRNICAPAAVASSSPDSY